MFLCIRVYTESILKTEFELCPRAVSRNSAWTPRVPQELLDRAYEALKCPQRPAAETPHSLSLFDVRRLETCDGCCAFGPMAR